MKFLVEYSGSAQLLLFAVLVSRPGLAANQYIRAVVLAVRLADLVFEVVLQFEVLN